MSYQCFVLPNDCLVVLGLEAKNEQNIKNRQSFDLRNSRDNFLGKMTELVQAINVFKAVA